MNVYLVHAAESLRDCRNVVVLPMRTDVKEALDLAWRRFNRGSGDEQVFWGPSASVNDLFKIVGSKDNHEDGYYRIEPDGFIRVVWNGHEWAEMTPEVAVYLAATRLCSLHHFEDKIPEQLWTDLRLAIIAYENPSKAQQ